MEKEDIDFFQFFKLKFKLFVFEIKVVIKEYCEFFVIDNNKKLVKYQLKNEYFRKMFVSYDVMVIKFQLKYFIEDKLCQIIGVILWFVKMEIKLQENGIFGLEVSLVDSFLVVKNESSLLKLKDDKLLELNEFMEFILKVIKDFVVVFSFKVMRKFVVFKEFSLKVIS